MFLLANVFLGKCFSGQMSLWANVFLGKCLSGQMSFGQMSFWANVFLGKCLSGQMSFWANVFWANVFWANVLISGQMSFWAILFLGKCLLVKCPSGQMSFWANVFWANVFWANVDLGKCLWANVSGQMSLGKFSMGKCRITIINSQHRLDEWSNENQEQANVSCVHQSCQLFMIILGCLRLFFALRTFNHFGLMQ
jgi:hypothetical protein